MGLCSQQTKAYFAPDAKVEIEDSTPLKKKKGYFSFGSPKEEPKLPVHDRSKKKFPRSSFEGWLWKKSQGAFRKWQARYFVLVEDHIQYFRNFNEPSPSGVIWLSTEKPTKEKGSDNHAFRFNVVSLRPLRTYQLCADTEEYREEWMKILSNINKKKEKELSTRLSTVYSEVTAVSGDVLAVLNRQCRGNPLLTIEVARNLKFRKYVLPEGSEWILNPEKKIETCRLPGSLSFYNAQIDKLGPLNVMVSKLASLFHHEFSYQVLLELTQAETQMTEEVFQEVLQNLVSREILMPLRTKNPVGKNILEDVDEKQDSVNLIRQASESGIDVEALFEEENVQPQSSIFKWADELLRLACYGTLLFYKRSELHGQVSSLLDKTQSRATAAAAAGAVQRQASSGSPVVVESEAIAYKWILDHYLLASECSRRIFKD